MRSPATTMRKLMVAGGLALALMGALPTGADAGTVSTVLGTVDCDPITGEQLITWSWENNSSEVVNFDSGVADASGLSAGLLVSTVVGMQPDTGLVLQGVAVGETIASADSVGTVSVTLVWFRTTSQLTLQVQGSVLLFGDCALPETTAVPDTTSPDTTPPDPTTVDTSIVGPQTTTAVGSGGGSLPHAGSDDTLLYIGAGLMMIGVALLAVRRRGGMSDPSQLR